MFKWVQKAGCIGAAALMIVGLSGVASNVALGSNAGLAVSEIEAHELTDLEVAYQVLEFRQDVFSAQQEKVGVLATALDQALDHYADGSTDGLRGDVPLLVQRVTQSFRAFDRAQDHLQSLELEVGDVEYAIEVLAFFAD